MNNKGGNTTSAQRIQAISIAEAGIDKKIAAASAEMTLSFVYKIIKKAKDRGYNKDEFTIMKMKYVVDDPRSERFLKVTSKKTAEVLNLDEHCLRYINCFVNKFSAKRQELSREICSRFRIRNRSFLFYYS